jgi:hypothetical protein
MPMEQDLLTSRFLNTLRKNRENWENNKQFTKIIKKMEKGKNLKKKEFEKIYFLLRGTGKYWPLTTG